MLTHRQRECLEYIESEIAATGGVAPSYEMIATALGLANRSGVHRLVTCLEQRGHIRRLPAHARAIEVIRSADAMRKTKPTVRPCISVPVMGHIS